MAQRQSCSSSDRRPESMVADFKNIRSWTLTCNLFHERQIRKAEEDGMVCRLDETVAFESSGGLHEPYRTRHAHQLIIRRSCALIRQLIAVNVP